MHRRPVRHDPGHPWVGHHRRPLAPGITLQTAPPPQRRHHTAPARAADARCGAHALQGKKSSDGRDGQAIWDVARLMSDSLLMEGLFDDEMRERIENNILSFIRLQLTKTLHPLQCTHQM